MRKGRPVSQGFLKEYTGVKPVQSVSMRRARLLLTLVLSTATLLLAEFNGGIFSDPDLGFSFAPPSGMRDITAFGQEQIRRRAEAQHAKNTLSLILSMASGPDDTAPDWHSLAIEAYPKWRSPDDFSAEAKMDDVVAGGRAVRTGAVSAVSMAGQTFAMANYAQNEPPLTKHAVVYSTVRDGTLVAFAFSGNSEEQVRTLIKSMETLKFKPSSTK